MSDKSEMLVKRVALTLLSRGLNSSNIRFNEEFVAELEKLGAVIFEPDQGDGTALPEENFWDDRTTPHAYSETDSKREEAAREAGWDAIRTDSGFIDATPQSWFFAGWNARSGYRS